MNRDRYESLDYDGRLYDEIRRIESENEDLQKELKNKDNEIERLNKIIEDIKKFIKGYDMGTLTHGELEMLRSIELILNGIVKVNDKGE